MSALAVCLAACRGQDRAHEGGLRKVTLATTPVIYTGLIAVAEQGGFFRKAGLDVTVLADHAAGLSSMQALERGEVQMATGAALVFAALVDRDPSFRVVAVIGSTDDHEIVARRDKGIREPPDLKGKRVGVVKDTVSEFALSAFLRVQAIDPGAVTAVSIAPDKIVEALARGEVDAISMWGRFSFAAKQLLGQNAISWPSQNTMNYQWVLATRENLPRVSHDVMARVLSALHEAEQFTLRHKDEAKDMIMRRWGLAPEFMEQYWDRNRLRVILDQTLLDSLQTYTRWHRAKSGKTEEPPNFLEYISTSALDQIDPTAVTIFR